MQAIDLIPLIVLGDALQQLDILGVPGQRACPNLGSPGSKGAASAASSRVHAGGRPGGAECVAAGRRCPQRPST